ncbi:MAG: hypothetical protein JNL98_35470 [Bryobacterales bacterium]|nr:hypothetical protein [Bryobacterales bacterium]
MEPGQEFEVEPQSLSRVICDLEWKELQPAPVEYSEKSGFPTFSPVPGASLVTPSHVEELLYTTEDQVNH